MSDSSTIGLSIGAVERDTGLSKDTLRVWERRYHFPSPVRDEFGERLYPPDQVEKLRIIKSLMDQGYRPGKIVGASLEDLRAMTAPAQAAAAVAGPVADRGDLLHCIDLCKRHRIEDLHRHLSQSLLAMGLHRFVIEVAAPLTSMVGDFWADGTLAVFEEHLYTECMQAVLRTALGSIRYAAPASLLSSRPRILLTTMPNEVHGLGLLMAEALFTLEGAHCIALGVQTPVMEIAQAAAAQTADIVALSFSAAMRPAQVLEAIADLRMALPADTEVWAGGRCSVLYRRPPAEARVLELDEIRERLADWRLRRLP